MKNGRKPKPAWRTGEQAQGAGRKEPGMPRTLSREARAEWRRVVPYLSQHCGLLACDRALLATYCELWADVLELRAAVAEGGRTYETKSGIVRARPEVGMLHVAERLLRGYQGELGLTPAARLALEGTGSGTGSSAMDEYLGELKRVREQPAPWGDRAK